MKPFNAQLLPCFLCGESLDLRTSKNGKPYFVCEPCGTQFFIRGKRGIERLDELLKTISISSKKEINPAALFELHTKLGEIEGIKREIGKIENEMSLFPSDHDVRVRDAVRGRLDKAVVEFEESQGK